MFSAAVAFVTARGGHLTNLILRDPDPACADKHGRAEPPYLPCEDDASASARPLVAAEGNARDKRALTAACVELSTLTDTASVLASIPRLALLLCPARGAQLLEITPAGTSNVLAATGVPFVAPPSQVNRHARSTLSVYLTLEAYLFSLGNDASPDPVQADSQPILALSIRGVEGSRLLLVLERGPGSIFWRQEIRELEIFGFLASSALSRTRSDAALQASSAIESALVGAVRDAVIALDGNGVIRALSGSAATLIGRRSKEIVGQRLRELPGMAPLALALAAGDRGPETVKLSTGGPPSR